MAVAAIVWCAPLTAFAKCVNTVSYELKGYLEDASNNPVTGKSLSTVLFDVYYDDGTSSLNNAATAEMGNGWYRYSYTANGKDGVWTVEDSTATLKQFPGGLLELLCDSQGIATVTTTGTPTTTVVQITENIAAANDYVGYQLSCGIHRRYITKTDETTETIHVEYGNPFPAAPGTGDTCSIEQP